MSEEEKEELIRRLGKPHLPLNMGLQAIAIQMLELEQGESPEDEDDECEDEELAALLKLL